LTRFSTYGVAAVSYFCANDRRHQYRAPLFTGHIVVIARLSIALRTAPYGPPLSTKVLLSG